MKSVVLIAAVLVLASCSGEESDVPAQTPSVRVEATGIVTDGRAARAHVIAGKGTAGTARVSRTSDSGEYTLSLTDLSGPYLFSNTLSPGGDPSLVVLTTVATRAGVANLTPLTTLLTAQLLGVTPGDAIVSFNDSVSVDTLRITDAGISAAQAELTAFLQDAYGVQVKTGTASFIETPFTPTAGDAMYDTILALDARLAENGTTLKALAEQVATGARACFTEVLNIVVNGAQKKFCPVFKSALPVESDTTLIDYVFRNVSNESLTFRAGRDGVLSAAFVGAGGETFTCEGAGCGMISLGAPADDLTRPVVFANATFTGAAGSAMANGTLVSAVPGITIPPLPCASNRFFVIFEDRSVIGDCVDSNHPLNIAGTFGGIVGPGQEAYLFVNSSAPSPEEPRLEIVIDYSTPTPTPVSVYYFDIDPAIQTIRNRYACQGTACNGVALGPVTVNTSAGFPVEVVPVNLQDTALSGFNGDGSATGASVMVRASLIALRDPSQVVAYPLPANCAPGMDAIAARVADAEFNLCMPQNDVANGFIYRTATDIGNGHIQLSLGSDAGDQIILNLRDEELMEVLVSLSSTGEQFRCSTDCAGIAVSAADGAGIRTVSFTDSRLRRVQSFPLPGNRTLAMSSGTLSIPPL